VLLESKVLVLQRRHVSSIFVVEGARRFVAQSLYGNQRVNITIVKNCCKKALYLYERQIKIKEEFDGPAVSALGVQSRKLSNVLNGQS
jgi:hypothetical protein